jgi:spore coat protein CotF
MSDPSKAAATISEKELLNDFLMTQKQMTSSYNTYAGECVNTQLKNTFLNILDEEHKIQTDIFSDMQAKGWYQVETADQTKITQTRQKLAQG